MGEPVPIALDNHPKSVSLQSWNETHDIGTVFLTVTSYHTHSHQLVIPGMLDLPPNRTDLHIFKDHFSVHFGSLLCTRLFILLYFYVFIVPIQIKQN